MKIISAKQRADQTWTAYQKKHGISAVMQAILDALDNATAKECFFAQVKNSDPLPDMEAAYLYTLGYRITSTPLYNGSIGPNGKYDHYIDW